MSTLQSFAPDGPLTEEQKVVLDIVDFRTKGALGIQKVDEWTSGLYGSKKFVYHFQHGNGSFHIPNYIFREENPVKAYKARHFSLGISSENSIIRRLETDLAKAKGRLRELQTKLKDLESDI